MASHNGNGNSRASEAVNACPRRQITRPVKELSYQLTNHVNAYLDHQRYEQAFALLQSLLTVGTSVSTPAKPHVGLLAPAAQLALASTLVVYPLTTTRTNSTEAHKGADAALRYLRCVHDTIEHPCYTTIREAFTFSDARRRATALQDSLSTPSSPSRRQFRQLHDDAANSKSLWSCAEDFWHVVGWAFNCSAIHKKRWGRWKLWLELMLDFLERDWTACVKNSDPHAEDPSEKLRESLIWWYISSQEPTAGNTRKRMVGAMLATGDAQSLKHYSEIWNRETEEPRVPDSRKKPAGTMNLDEGDLGEFASDDGDDEMDDAPQSAAKNTRSSRNIPQTSVSSLPPLEDAFIPDCEAAITRLGGIEAVQLRQRLIALIAEVAQKLPNIQFTSLEGFCDSLSRNISYLPAPILHVLVSTSQMRPAVQLVLNVTILTATLTFDNWIDYTERTPTQPELEECLLPLQARLDSLTANAKMSLVLEQVVMYMMDEGLLQPSKALRKAVETGIKNRRGIKGRKDSLEGRTQAEALLKASSQRLLGMLEVLDMFASGISARERPSMSALSDDLSTPPESENDD